MGFGKHKHTGMDKTISGGGGYEGIYFYQHYQATADQLLSWVNYTHAREKKKLGRA